jgi:glycosyltransferase involved in cell wall biosynthesis
VRVVSTYPIPFIEKVEAIYPRAWLCSLVGNVPGRLLTFVWVGWRTRPHVVGGFHFLMNGMVAAVLARIVGAQSLYFSVGGPAEVVGGGTWSENRLFARLTEPDPVIERRLLGGIADLDLVVTMGNIARGSFRERGVSAPFRTIPGGIDGARFHPSDTRPTLDLILVARLVPIKRVELFLEAVKHVQRTLPDVTAAIVGDGPLRGSLERLAGRLDLGRNIVFTGSQSDVATWLRRARVFVLTSISEGLPLSSMEAMRCGLPVVAPPVGELPELIEDGVNGYLVTPPTPAAFAVRLVDLLNDSERLARFGAAAEKSAARYDVLAITAIWDDVLASDHLRGDGHMTRP